MRKYSRPLSMTGSSIPSDHNEVHYRVVPGSGLLFRSNLHHRTCKAEEGVWKLALFFGFFLTDPRECMRKKR